MPRKKKKPGTKRIVKGWLKGSMETKPDASVSWHLHVDGSFCLWTTEEIDDEEWEGIYRARYISADVVIEEDDDHEDREKKKPCLFVSHQRRPKEGGYVLLSWSKCSYSRKCNVFKSTSANPLTMKVAMNENKKFMQLSDNFTFQGAHGVSFLNRFRFFLDS